MTTNISNSLIGLSILTGGSGFTTPFAGISFESRAVRQAKAQFTAPPTVAPWQQPTAEMPFSAQVSAIQRLVSIIDKPTTRDGELLPDIQTAFTAYKALDRLRVLAEHASKATTATSVRTSLQEVFQEGLADLQSYLGSAPSDEVRLSFGLPTRSSQSVEIARATPSKTLGAGLLASRDAAIPGIAGNEVLQISLSKYGLTDSVTVDLSQTPQPPTLDSVAQALNAAIATVPMRTPDGSIVLDGSGNPVPKYQTSFAADKGSGEWGLSLQTVGIETVALDQVGAKDALIVATGRTALDSPTTTSISRYDDPATAFTLKTIGTIAAVDRDATALAAAATPAKPPADGAEAEPVQVWATTTTRAIVTGADGSSYAVGTTTGDLGSNLSNGGEDLFLTKLDSEGEVVWQRTLGVTGSAQGAAVTIAPNGDVVVAGTVTGPFNGSLGTDSDMVVIGFDANGDEKFATSIRTVGDQEATAIAVGADGTMFVGGKTASGGGDAFIARLSATGTLQERRVIDSGGTDGVTALAIDGSGELLALTKEGATAQLRRLDAQSLATDLGAISLGSADARAIAVSATGEIAVAGAARGALPGTQVNATAGDRDGFVARIDSALTGSSISYIGSSADDQIDSITYMGGAIYVGGRTTGALDGARTGAVDGFVSRIDGASGAVQSTTQFGQPALRTEPVRVAAAIGGAGITGLLGFHRSTLNPPTSIKLVAQTSLRAGDEFSIRVGEGAVRKIVIGADDTLATLAERLRQLTGTAITITTPRAGSGSALRIEPKAGQSIELIAGADGKDALAKLGFEPARIATPAVLDDDAPKVQPGGAFGLALTESLSIATAKDAASALELITSAISMTQTAYRSLYWDDGKAALVNGVSMSGGGTPYQQAQLAMYQDALVRIQSITGIF